MESNEILGIFRVDKHEYLELILDGKLRFTPIEKYKVAEDKEYHRNDSMEGLKRVSQDAGRKDWIPFVFDSGPAAGVGFEIRVVTQVKVAGALPNTSVLCFSTVTRTDIPELGEFSKYKMDPRMFEFGNVALVIQDIRQFIDRFLAKAKGIGLKPDNGSVGYVDGDRFEGAEMRPVTCPMTRLPTALPTAIAIKSVTAPTISVVDKPARGPIRPLLRAAERRAGQASPGATDGRAACRRR